MSVVIRLKVPIEMHYTVITMGTSKVNSSHGGCWYFDFATPSLLMWPWVKCGCGDVTVMVTFGFGQD